MRPPLLTQEEIHDLLATLPDWSLANGKLHRDYAFADFCLAFGFMAAAATAIERMNHHPEWCNVYNRVSVDLTTHDAGGITSLDAGLARLLESIARKLS